MVQLKKAAPKTSPRGRKGKGKQVAQKKPTKKKPAKKKPVKPVRVVVPRKRTLRSRTRSIKQRVKVRPGFIVADTSTASGGVHYHREYDTPTLINDGQGLKMKLHTTKTVDNVDVVAALDALKKRADYACRKHCTRTGFGWFADEVSLRALRKEIAELRIEAQTLNAAAIERGSKRSAYVNVVAGKLDIVNTDTAREIARTIREVLIAVHAALRSGCVKKIVDEDGDTIQKDYLHGPLLKCKNLDRLVVDQAGEVVSTALKRIPAAKKEILERTKEGAQAEEAEDVGADLDLGVIENAITWFEDDEIGAGSGASYNPVEVALKL